MSRGGEGMSKTCPHCGEEIPGYTYADRIAEIEGDLDWFEEARKEYWPTVHIDLGSFAVPQFPELGPTLLILERPSDIASLEMCKSMSSLFAQPKSVRLEVWCEAERIGLCGCFYDFVRLREDVLLGLLGRGDQ
jgi:hypothetical protein